MSDPHTNPLVSRKANNKGPVTREQLEELAARLNRSAFVKDQGWHYFVGRRFINDEWKAVLDRNDSALS